MSTASTFKSHLHEDVDEIVLWARALRPRDAATAFLDAMTIGFRQDVEPASQIKAIAVLQTLVSHSADISANAAAHYVATLCREIERTNHAELQFIMTKALVGCLAVREDLTDDDFDQAAELIKCLSRTITYPFAREFLASVQSVGSTYHSRNRSRMKAKRLPVSVYIGDIALPHKRASRELARRNGEPWVSFGDYIAKEAEKILARKPTRADLQDIGQSWVERDPRGLCSQVLASAKDWEPGLPLVVDGLRHKKVLAAIRELVAPCDVVVYRVDAPTTVRLQYVEQKFGKEFTIIREAPAEQEVDELEASAVMGRYLASPIPAGAP